MPEDDPATAENLRALRLKISGDENGARPLPLPALLMILCSTVSPVFAQRHRE
jgi:hypothetical protein